MGQVRKFFAGGNTSRGFISFFHEIIPEGAGRRLILKGGPGTGKSTLMATIAREMNRQGYDLEKFYCSSDVASLDGVAIPRLQTAIVDGTPPHVVEPRYPGSVDQIIDLGVYWNAAELQLGRDEIIGLTKQNKACYSRAYRYLQAAKVLDEDTSQINQSCLDHEALTSMIRDFLRRSFSLPPKGRSGGKARHLFAAAITPQGQVSHISSIMTKFARKIIIKGEIGGGSGQLLETAYQYGTWLGYDLEVYHSPLDPGRIDHLGIEALDLALITCPTSSPDPDTTGDILDLNEFIDFNKRQKYQYVLHKNLVLFDELFDLAIKQLAQASAIYTKLEQKYIPHMDFAKIQQLSGDLVARIIPNLGH